MPTEYVLGPAIEALGVDPGPAVANAAGGSRPPRTGGAPCRTAATWRSSGVTVLSLVVGRRLRDDEFPERLEGLVGSARQRTPTVVDAPLSAGLRTWLLRALQLQAKNFTTLFDAQMALERLLATETALIAQPAELDVAMARLERFMPVFEPPSALPELVALPEIAASPDDWAPPAPVEWVPPPPPPRTNVVAMPVAAAAFEPSRPALEAEIAALLSPPAPVSAPVVFKEPVPPAPVPAAAVVTRLPVAAPREAEPRPDPSPQPFEAIAIQTMPWWRSSPPWRRSWR